MEISCDAAPSSRTTTTATSTTSTATGQTTTNDSSAQRGVKRGLSPDIAPLVYPPGSVYGMPHNYGNVYFVNRCAEALHIFINALKKSSTYYIALGYQLMGAGKTALGFNAVSVLRRPREAPGDEEDFIAERLRHCPEMFRLKSSADDLIQRAKARPENETLVTRVLREYLSSRRGSSATAVDAKVDAAKDAVTTFVRFGRVDARTFTSLDSLVAHVMFEVLGLPTPEQDIDINSACTIISEAVGGKVVFLVLDEIGDLLQDRYHHLYSKPLGAAVPASALAMDMLRELIIHIYGAQLGWMVYCTGRTEWLSMSVLAGPASPLRAQGVLLAPLHARDIRELMQRVPQFRGSDDADVQLYIAEAIAKRSGGVARMVVEALDLLWGKGLATTKEEADAVINTLELRILNVPWLFPKATTNISDLQEPSLLAAIGPMVLFGQRFIDYNTILVKMGTSDKHILITSALTAFGFNFAPAPDAPDWLVPIAGDWHLASLMKRFPPGAADTATFELLQALQSANKGKYLGDPFETLCIYQAMRTIVASVAPNARRKVGEIFPFLSGTAAATNTIGKRLRPRRLPMVTSAAPILSDYDKASVNLGSSLKVIHPSDLHWLLYEVLREDEVGISSANLCSTTTSTCSSSSASTSGSSSTTTSSSYSTSDSSSASTNGSSTCRNTSTNCSQDWFIRTQDIVIGLSSKNTSLTHTAVLEELDKRPVSGTYILVLLSPSIEPELISAMQDSPFLALTEEEVRNNKCFRWDRNDPLYSSSSDHYIVIVHPNLGLNLLFTDAKLRGKALYATKDPDMGSLFNVSEYSEGGYFLPRRE